MTEQQETHSRAVISVKNLQALIASLKARGYKVLGPVLRDGAIAYDEVSNVSDLPVGWTDKHEPGRYRLERRTDGALFGYAVGPHSWKQFLHPPAETLWTAHKSADGVTISGPRPPQEKFAFLGVRACEIQAIAVQDRVFCNGPYPDTAYAARRRNALIVAVNCSVAGGTCFCASMEAGPKAASGFDLSLTEIIADGVHEFVVEAGSEAGFDLLKQLPHSPASAEQIAAAEAVIERTSNRMGRRLDTKGLKELLQDNLKHPRWDEVAQRCLTCGNCTMVCPTCFCTTVEDHSDLTGAYSERVRKWDSCFSLDFSYIHGGAVRNSGRSRYRQWMTHKLANWIDQFGTSGCVGCGRCITWCPVGIDITEEAAAIRATPQAAKQERNGRP